MIPSQLHMKRQSAKNEKHDQRDNLLNHLELHQRERTAVTLKTNTVGGYLQAVFEERDAPREEDHKNKRRGVGEEAGLLQLQMAVPRKRHEDIRR